MEKTNHKKVYIPLQKFEHTAFAYVNDMESFLKLADALHQHLIFRLPMHGSDRALSLSVPTNSPHRQTQQR